MGYIQLWSQDNLQTEQFSISELIDRLGRRHHEEAAQLLIRIGDPCVQPLIEAMNEKMGTMRYRPYRSALVLGRIGTQQCEEALADAVGNETLEEFVRRAAITGLGYIHSERGEKILTDLLKDKNKTSRLRARATQALGYFSSDQVINLLVSALDDPDQGIRYNAASALGQIGSEKAIEAILTTIRTNPTIVSNEHVRNALAQKGTLETIDALVWSLSCDNWYARSGAAKTLENLGEKSVDSLIRYLKDEDPEMRWRSAWILGKIRSRRSVAAFLEALEDPDWMVQNEAAVALARIQDTSSIQSLIILLNHSVANVRQEAAWILGEMQSDQAVEFLLRLLKDQEMGWMAAISLGKIQSPRALKPLMQMLKDKNVRRKRAAVWALARLGSERSVNALKRALKDKDQEVRILILHALNKIGSPKAMQGIKEYQSRMK
jgi:HEAT repeat protein